MSLFIFHIFFERQTNIIRKNKNGNNRKPQATHKKFDKEDIHHKDYSSLKQLNVFLIQLKILILISSTKNIKARRSDL